MITERCKSSLSGKYSVEFCVMTTLKQTAAEKKARAAHLKQLREAYADFAPVNPEIELPEPKKNLGGRPKGSVTYTEELATSILELLSAGVSLREICRRDDMPARVTIHGWIIDDLHGFASRYTQAREIAVDEMADELFDIADDGRNDWVERENERTGSTFVALNDEAIQRARLRVDTRKWYLAKIAPKRFGDKQQVEHTGTINLVNALKELGDD